MILQQWARETPDVKDYDIDYAPWLDPVADTLYDITATVRCLTSDDDSLVVDRIDITATTAKLWISGGQSGQRYRVRVIATTSSTPARIDASELDFTVRNY